MSIFPRAAMNAAGALFVMSAPSGTGKTTIVRHLLARCPNLVLSISHTTRAPRPSETEGTHYFFTDEATFKAMRAADEFLESAEVYGHFYGTSRAWVEATRATGKDILLEIDCQGALQVRRHAPEAVLIFIAPPDMATLRQRLTDRREDDRAAIEARLQAAEAEMRRQNKFDCVIINDNLQDAVDKIETVINQHLQGPHHGKNDH